MSEPTDTGWVDSGIGGHIRTIGKFELTVDPSGHGAMWWSVETVDHEAVLAGGRETHGPDVLARAKRGCEDAARKAGIAVPK